MKWSVESGLAAALFGALLWVGGAQPVVAGTNVWTPIGTGGTIIDLAIDPRDPSILYAVGGGVLKSIDGGGRWSSIGDDLRSFAVSKIVIDPRTTSTLYAVTGSNGVFKSTDGGQSWQSASAGLAGSLKVNALVIDPQTPRILYASLDPEGVYKSADGGGSWARSDIGILDFQLECWYCRNVLALAVDPGTPTILYAGTQSGAIFKSTDGGGLWKPDPTLPRYGSSTLSFAIDPHDSRIVYANSWCGGILKSLDAGGSWMPTGLSQARCSGPLVLGFFMDPRRTTTLYALIPTGDLTTTLLKSTDGAATWSDSGNGRFRTTTLAIDPQIPTTLYAGLWEEGVLKSVDAGATWSAINSGLPPGALSGLAVDSATPATIYGLTQDRPFKSIDGGDTWRPVAAGLHSDFILNLLMDPKAPATLYLRGRSYGAGYSDCISRSTDGAETWRPVFCSSPPGFGLDALIMDRETPAVLYTAASTHIERHASVFRSTDGGETWGSIWSGEGFATMSLEGWNPKTLFVKDARGRVFERTNRGWIETTWPSFHPRVLARDPGTPAILYGWDHGLYKSTDEGVTWNATGPGLPDVFIEGLFVDPVTTSTLYLASHGSGIFRSTDGGATWAEFNDGLMSQSARSVLDLIFDPRTPGTLHAQTSAGIFIISPPTRVLDPTIDFSSPEGKGSGVVQWRTDQERDLKGFNVVTIDAGGGRAQINPALIACQACGTGSKGDYAFIVPKHRSGRDLYIEQVYRDDHVERFGLTRQK